MSRFEPSNFSEEAAGALWSILRSSEYDCAVSLPGLGGTGWAAEPVRLARFLRGGVNCWRTSPFSAYYRALLGWRKGPAPLVLFDLFFLHKPVLRRRLEGIADADTIRGLEKASILVTAEEWVTATVRCYPLRETYFLFDPSRRDADFVYVGWDSHLMAEIAERTCVGRHFERSLDLCTGSGVQGLMLAAQSDEMICADISQRAVAFVEANARLNKLTNVRAVQSDAFSAISGRFDCVTANTPYVPEPEGGHLPIRGGDLGMEFTIRLLEELPDRLTDRGIGILYTSDPIVRGELQLMERVRERLGHLRLRVVQIPLFRNSYPITRPMQEHYDKLGLRGYDDCVLVVERAAGYEMQRRHWDWIHYHWTRIDTWVDWRRRSRHA